MIINTQFDAPNSAFTTIYFRRSPITVTLKRRYLKVAEIMTIIGGLLNIILISCSFIVR
jgi:hypothetical protein